MAKDETIDNTDKSTPPRENPTEPQDVATSALSKVTKKLSSSSLKSSLTAGIVIPSQILINKSFAEITGTSGPKKPMPIHQNPNRKRVRPEQVGSKQADDFLSNLPSDTPNNFYHPFIDRHPWGHLVNPRDRYYTSRLDDDIVTSNHPISEYRHIPDSGYTKKKFVQTLFPRVHSFSPRLGIPLPVYEVTGLEDAIRFREASQAAIDCVSTQRKPTLAENTRKQESKGCFPTCLAPPKVGPLHPVLYQVVEKGAGIAVTLECKDFYVFGPDRRDLLLISLDQFGTNIVSGNRGFDKELISVKDLIYVYKVEANRAALKSPIKQLELSRQPRIASLDQKASLFFRAAEFAIVRPKVHSKNSLGIVIAAQKTPMGKIRYFKVAFEGAPDAVTVPPSACKAIRKLEDVTEDDIMIASMRVNSSTAIRFSDPPSSHATLRTLWEFARGVIPYHPEEGLLPLNMDKIAPQDYRWFADRMSHFQQYMVDKQLARQKMSQAFNVACSTIAAITRLTEDKKTHRLKALVPSLRGYPIHMIIVIPDMSSEAGWSRNRKAIVWIIGSHTQEIGKVLSVQLEPSTRKLSIQVEFRGWTFKPILSAVTKAGIETDDGTEVEVCIRLGKSPTSADPAYETVSRTELFSNISAVTKSSEIIDTIYGNLSISNNNQNNIDSDIVSSSAEIIRSITMQGKHLKLRKDQILAIDRALNSESIITIQAPFGTGKTVVGTVIAGSNVLLKHKLVIMTAMMNAAVSRFTETLLVIDEFKDLTVLRFVSESASSETAPVTKVDLSRVLINLAESHGTTMDPTDRGTCEKFRKGRERYESYLLNPDCAVYLSQEEREDYLLCERDCSILLAKMIRLMFEYRPPSVICITAASLLNAAVKDGIFEGFFDQFSTIICDEASQTPEPVFLAIANQMYQSQFVCIGDVHQLQPHVRCPRLSHAARLGARGIMEILSHSTAVQTTRLMTTFRSHPRLNKFPNILSYQGTLNSGTPEVERRLILDALRLSNEKIPFAFIDVVGESVKAPSLSSYNEREVETCKNLVEGLLQVGIPQTSIVIITFYREQNRRIAGFAKERNIELSTVDAVQGREKDVVILLSTRTHFSVERADFLDDRQRMNVALTRSRHGQFVLGHKASLKQLTSWAILLEWAEKNTIVIKDHKIRNLFLKD